jgi:predicted transcriptional regulator
MFTRVETECAILERQYYVLDAVASHEPVGLITLSNRLAYPQHKIRYSLRVLEAEQLVESTPDGVTTTEQASEWRAAIDQQLERKTHRLETLRMDHKVHSTATSQAVATDS